MPITVVVGGHSRNIGKTSVVAGVVQDLSEVSWTAVKVTQYGHGICSVNGKSCHCQTEDHRFAVLEEKNRFASTDTSRFLAAGAQKSYWVRTKQGMLFEAMPSLRKLIARAEHVIIESNSVLRFFRPDLCLMVLDFGVRDFKESTKRFLDRADAYLLLKSSAEQPLWRDVPTQYLSRKPVFFINPPEYVNSEVMEFVRSRILCHKNPQD